MTPEQEAMLQKSLDNQQEIVDRLKVLQRVLNAISPHKEYYRKKSDEKTMSSDEAAKHLGIGSSQFSIRVRNGEIPFTKPKEHVGRRFTIEDLNSFITGNK